MTYRVSAFPWLRHASFAAVVAGAIFAGGCKSESEDKAASKPSPAKKGAETPAFDEPNVDVDAVRKKAATLFTPLPEVAETPDNPLTEAKIDLGRILYYENRLSKNHDISCNTCHVLDDWGIDPRQQEGHRTATSLGHRKQPGERNSPTVYNAALHVAQFWDGRAADVEEQAKGPILNPVEMAMPDETFVLRVLESIPGYKEKFAAAFPEEDDPITYDNMAKAIGAFERKLMTPAPFDAFLKGEDTLDPKQLEGLQLFLDVGCTTCHNGPLIGGNQFQKLGSVKPWPNYEDEGRAAVTKSAADKYVFKVPSLRNVTQTSPYLHNGSISTLEEVVAMMAEHQTARGKLETEEIAKIVAFLGSLQGEIPKDYIAEPALPEAGPDTPGPDPS